MNNNNLNLYRCCPFLSLVPFNPVLCLLIFALNFFASLFVEGENIPGSSGYEPARSF